MTITKVFADESGDSHFEEMEFPLTDQGLIGWLSAKIAVKSLQFRQNSADYNWDFHTVPEKQFVVLLDGGIEIETSLGLKKTFNSGEILLLEDITGKGHRTRNLSSSIRHSLFIQL